MKLYRWSGGILVVAAVAGAAWALDGPPVLDGPAVGVGGNTSAVSTSVAECKACHSGADQIGVRDFVQKFKSHEFIRLDESRIWDEKDPHSRAYSVLTQGDVAKRMSEKLKYDVLTDARCLSCHATDTHRPQDRFDTSNGVSCSGCHGVASDWQTEHYKTPNGVMTWRNLNAAQKHAKGMVNLRDPAVKAAACTSCHVGDAAAGRVITHEMYAAGHPPLPPFELLAFSVDQPRHWKDPADLPFFEKADDATRARFGLIPEDESRARHLLVGAVTSLKAEAKLLQDAAADSIRKQGGLAPVPLDYARFDCYACHHELRGANSDRQKRGYPGAPGRPPLKAWNGAMALVAAKAIGDEAAFVRAWDAAQAAAYVRPYADATAMADAAKALVVWCDSATAHLARPITETQSVEVMKIMTAMLGDEKILADPEAAMVLLWAVKALSNSNGPWWDGARKVLPVGPQEDVDPNRTKPVTAGELLPERLRRFNAFSIEEFRKVSLP
jgi:hypothetical protein